MDNRTAYNRPLDTGEYVLVDETEEPEHTNVAPSRSLLGRLGVTGLAVSIILVAAILALIFVIGSYLAGRNAQGAGANGAVGATTSQPLAEGPRVGSIAPDFELRDVKTGQLVKLSSLRGKPVWLNFWATWCPPCKEEMPEMQQYYDKFKGQGLQIVSIDVQENTKDVLDFVTPLGLTWTFVIDPDGKIVDLYQIPGIPSHYFIDKDGVIRELHLGGLTTPGGIKAPVEEYLSKILK